MADLDAYPGVSQELDDTLPVTSISPSTDASTLTIKQEGDDGGLEIMFRRGADGIYSVVARDNVIDTSHDLAARVVRGGYTASSEADHAAVASTMRDQVGKLSSVNSPPGKNLACVWAVRTLVHNTLNRWITKTDGTAIFGDELERGFSGDIFNENDLPAGAIIISPTRKRHGHIGLLGERLAGGDRLIYSNRSSVGLWGDQWRLSTWKPHYHDNLGLDVLCYPLPSPSALGLKPIS